jgi:hypothetical protein
MRLEVLKPHRYAGRSMVAGETYEAKDKDAALLKLLRKAKDAPAEEPVSSMPKRERTYKRRDMVAEPAGGVDATADMAPGGSVGAMTVSALLPGLAGEDKATD